MTKIDTKPRPSASVRACKERVRKSLSVMEMELGWIDTSDHLTDRLRDSDEELISYCDISRAWHRLRDVLDRLEEFYIEQTDDERRRYDKE